MSWKNKQIYQQNEQANKKNLAHNSNKIGFGHRKFFGGANFNEQDRKKFRELDLKNLCKRLFQYMGRSKILLYYILALVLISSFFHALKPAILGKIIDNLTNVYMTKIFEPHSLLELLAIFIGVSILASLGHYAQGYFSARFAKEFIMHLREDVFNTILSLPISYIDRHSHGDLMSRVTNDTDSITQVLSQTIANFFSNIVSIFTVTAIMLYLSPFLTLLIYIFIPISIYFTKMLSKKMRYYFRHKHESLGKLEGSVEENIYAYETLFAYNQRESTKTKFNAINEEYRNYSIKSNILSNLVNPVLSVLSGLTYVIIAIAGAILVLKSVISIGTIQAFLLYIRQLTFPLNGIAAMYAQIQSAFAAADRIFALLDESKEFNFTKNITINNNFEPLLGEIEIKNFYFAYAEGQNVFEDLNLHIHKGEKVAIVGETGSGKTSLINVIMKFYPFASGEILLDGKALNNYDLSFLRQNIALVLQEPFIFSGTIKENICYGSQHNDDEITKAAMSANAHNFIKQLPKGYDTIIGNEGHSLSIGQKQLICLARTFMKNAPILILDEATANIDTLTEQNIQDAIIKLMKDKTCIVIAHRLSTIINMDRIIVLHQGKIVESGNHEELLAKEGQYFHLYYSK